MTPATPVHRTRLTRQDLVALRSVLAVCAHPDDETFGLGAIISGLVDGGSAISLLCFTRGEATTLGGDASANQTRAGELSRAASILGIASVELLDYPDGRLDTIPTAELASQILEAIAQAGAQALLVFDADGVTGHPDHRRATAAAIAAGDEASIPVPAWVIPNDVATTLNREFGTSFKGRERDEVDVELVVDRTRQTLALSEHKSQSRDNPVLWRRLELMGPTEWLIDLNTGTNRRN